MPKCMKYVGLCITLSSICRRLYYMAELFLFGFQQLCIPLYQLGKPSYLAFEVILHTNHLNWKLAVHRIPPLFHINNGSDIDGDKTQKAGFAKQSVNPEIRSVFQYNEECFNPLNICLSRFSIYPLRLLDQAGPSVLQDI